MISSSLALGCRMPLERMSAMASRSRLRSAARAVASFVPARLVLRLAMRSPATAAFGLETILLAALGRQGWSTSRRAIALLPCCAPAERLHGAFGQAGHVRGDPPQDLLRRSAARGVLQVGDAIHVVVRVHERADRSRGT